MRHKKGLSSTWGTLLLSLFPLGINVPGFHLHFLSEDHAKGGHLTECTAGELELVLVPLYEYTISLPASEAFRQADLRKNRSDALSEVERPKAPAEITE